MTKTLLTTLALAGALTFGSATVASAQDSGALLDALVRKKVLTSQEAEDVRADLIKENAASNAGKLQLSNSVTSLKIYGDVRLRYQYDNKDPQIETPLAGSNYLFTTNENTFMSSVYSKNDGATKFSSSPWTTDSKGYVTANANVYDSKGNLIVAQGKPLLNSRGQQIRGVGNPSVTGVGSPQNGTQTSRERIRLRLNGDFTLAGGFFGGVMIQTGQAADSGNQTMGDSTNGAAGFGNYSMYISRAFVGWGNDWLTLVGGKQPNPFYATDLVWGTDINPEGFVEKVDLLKLFTGGNSETVSTTADGKQVSSVSTARSASPFELSLVAGQFVISDNPEDAFGTNFNTDAWLFTTQLVGSAKVAPGVKVTLAPGLMTYTVGNTANLNNTVSFAGGVNPYQYSVNAKDSVLIPQSANRALTILTLPGDVSFKLLGQKVKVLWDFAYNTQGKDRVEQVYGLQNIQIPSTYDANGNVTQYKNTHGAVTNSTLVSTTRVSGHSSRDDVAWLAGVQVGENKKAGDWSVLANFRQTGLGAVDPNLNDPNFALGYLNTQGVKVGAAYNLTDFVVGAITYYDAWNLRGDLVGGDATGGQKIASMNAVQVFQVDLNVKF
ncbi:MAG: putative porin [Verrucomicrobiota bacterium]